MPAVLPYRPVPLRALCLSVGLLVSGMGGVAAQGIGLPDADILAAQQAQYDAAVPGSVFALNPLRNSQTATGADGTNFRLTSVNPAVNSWFVVEITAPGARPRSYHLENADPALTQISLGTEGGVPALLLDQDGLTTACAPWENGALAAAAETDLPFAPVCDWALFLRNPVRGNRTTREAVSQFLRDNVVFGDQIVNLIKGAFFEDAFMVSSEGLETEAEISGVDLLGTALLSQTPAMRPAMGFDLDGTDGGAMTAGSWYEVTDAPGIYASVMQPGMIAREVFSVPGANGLDGVENRADVYLVAFDMSRFDLGYEIGTDHPALGWSPRPSGAGRHNQGPGPDGFDRPDPLVFNGMLSPVLYETVAATFTGGFKREHGAWRFGDYATFNWGHHYGFLTHGVTFSRLWPTLATLYVLDDGTIGMRSWTEEDAALSDRLVFARQNGVPLIENGVPGDRVTSWGGGNWSGSAEANLRTLRAGACLRSVEGRQFLIYAYFSAATPSGMARTFQAYQCDYAMLLDMNSQELTYMALYTRQSGDLETRHLVRGMSEADPGGVPRFIAAPDNRDFFYLVRRD
ncbi:hypothetical protein [Roseicyclus marinus]|uniref:hypothetical protein n=1 Tax=Roseicyclus marinus TaxID=2161673 RepID=UPI00240FDB3D|nr:hypothetical protein [Roseicyclus marinus]MDG3042969.1 hypothetical protein [Roseicyclus marinus]